MIRKRSCTLIVRTLSNELRGPPANNLTLYEGHFPARPHLAGLPFYVPELMPAVPSRSDTTQLTLSRQKTNELTAITRKEQQYSQKDVPARFREYCKKHLSYLTGTLFCIHKYLKIITIEH